MKEKKLNKEQKKEIARLMEEWKAEIHKLPEPTGYPLGTFSNALANEKTKPYRDLREKYLKLINDAKKSRHGKG